MGEGRDYSVGKYISRKLASGVSLTKDHLVVEIDASGELILGTAAGKPYAVAARSTQDKLARVAGITQHRAAVEVPVARSGVWELPLPATHAAIKIGDRIVVGSADDGTVDVDNTIDTTSAATLLADLEKTVGFAEEAKAQDAGGTVLTSLSLFKGGGP